MGYIILIYQWIRLDKFYKLMESFFSISESFFELTTTFKNNTGVGFMHAWRGKAFVLIKTRCSLNSFVFQYKNEPIRKKNLYLHIL